MSDSEVSKPQQPPLSFWVVRHHDRSKVSRTGFVAQGIQWSDGGCAVYWVGETPCTQVWRSVEHFIQVHGHDGETTIEWINGEPGVEWMDRLAECTS